MGKKKSQIPYLRELKTVSRLLSQQKSWQDTCYKDIFKSVALLSFSYAGVLDDHIRLYGEYGCPVREKVFTDHATQKGFYPSKDQSDIQTQLAANLMIFKAHPEKFSEEEAECYKRVRLLAEMRANRYDVERTILNETPYDPDSSDKYLPENKRSLYVKREDDDENAYVYEGYRPQRRPAKLQYQTGVTEDTKQLHYILTAYHNKLPELLLA